LTLNGILAQSSNIGTILASEKIGRDKFLSYLDRFGIGHNTGLNFPGESASLLPKPGTTGWSGTSFPTLAFGQGLSVTALQATTVFATIANDGVRMTPRLIDAYVDPNGTVVPTDASEATRVVSATTAKTIREMLESVVGKEGTAPAAQIPGYRVAGKTGTANKYDEKLHGYHGYTASFIGFAPAEAPQLVVAVMVHNPVNGHFGATVAAPVFREVMMYALAQQRVPPSTTKAPKIPVTW
jgi:cell division protein FtsI (penicillin-binding protein 3)